MPLDDAPKSKGSRMLRGLDPIKHIIEIDTQKSIEQDEEDETKPPTSTHAARSTRRGRSEVIYDAKYHPMDAVTRPNARATQRHRSKSLSFAEDASSETEDESALSSPTDSEDDDRSQDDSSDSELQILSATQRKQDPRAVRHSARGEAQKYVNYSKKFHPQDIGIPGYQHKAKYAVHVDSARSTPIPTPQAKKRKSKSPSEKADEVAATPEPQPRGPPRKKLRSIETKSKSKKKSKSTPPPSKRQSSKKPQQKKLASKGDRRDVDGLEDLIEFAIAASEAPKKPEQATEVEDAEESNISDAEAPAVTTNSPLSLQKPKKEIEIEIGDSEDSDTSDVEAPAVNTKPPTVPKLPSFRDENSSPSVGPFESDGHQLPDAPRHSSHTLDHSDVDYQAIHETTTIMMDQDQDTQDMARTLQEACSPTSDTITAPTDANKDAAPMFDIPAFIQNRHNLANSSEPLAQEKALEMVLADYHTTCAPLNIAKPYLHSNNIVDLVLKAYQSPDSETVVGDEVVECGKESPFIFINRDDSVEPPAVEPSQSSPCEEGKEPAAPSSSRHCNAVVDGPMKESNESSLPQEDSAPCNDSVEHNTGDQSSEKAPAPPEALDEALHNLQPHSHFAVAMGDQVDMSTESNDPIDGFSDL